MERTRTTLTIDERLLQAARIEAARDGRRLYEVIEDALRARCDLRAARDRVRRPDAPDISEEDAMRLAVEASREVRAEEAVRRAG